MVQKKKAKRKPYKARLVPIHIKLSVSEFEFLKKRANWFALGDLSAWLRYAGMNYVPAKTENVSAGIVSRVSVSKKR